MNSKLLHAWRIATTGASFALFGVGGVLLAAVVFPCVALVSRGEDQRQRRVQYLVHLSLRFFVGFMSALRVVRVEVRGAEGLRDPKGQLVVANHPTLLDVVMMISRMPQVDCVVKAEWWRNPFMRGVTRAAGYLSNDQGDAMLAGCAQRLEAGRSVLVFPEGTRSPRRGLGRFQRGAAHVALRCGRPLRPVIITCEPPSLMRGQPWHDVPDGPRRYTLEVCDLVDPARFSGPGEPRGAAARKLTRGLRDFYEEKLQPSGRGR